MDYVIHKRMQNVLMEAKKGTKVVASKVVSKAEARDIVCNKIVKEDGTFVEKAVSMFGYERIYVYEKQH